MCLLSIAARPFCRTPGREPARATPKRGEHDPFIAFCLAPLFVWLLALLGGLRGARLTEYRCASCALEWTVREPVEPYSRVATIAFIVAILVLLVLSIALV